MLDFLLNLFSTAGFPPRWYCGEWTPLHGYLHISSDVATGLAYLAIPLTFLYFTQKRRDITLPPVSWLFASFIAFCGTVHFVEASLFWFPAYRLSGLLKLCTALVSIATLVALIRYLPRALELPSAARAGERLQREIQERELIEQELRRSQHELTNLFDLSLDIICITNPEGVLLRINKAFERILGYSTQELQGSRFVDLIHPEDKLSTQERFAQLLRGDTVYGYRNRYRTRDGQWRHLSWTSNLDPEQQLVYATARDITEQVQHEEIQKKQERALRETQRLESLGLLAGGVAHDFNNLLSIILGNAELLCMDMQAAQLDTEPAESIKQTTQRAAALCSQMLAYAGRGQFVIEPIDLSQQVLEMTELLHVSLSPNTSLHLDLDQDLPTIQTDAKQMRQIILNLVTNANEAISNKTGNITLRTYTTHLEVERIPHIPLGGSPPQDGHYLCLEIKDDGVGMTPEIQQQAFEPFFTTHFTGRGLGLAAVQGMVRNHKGLIQVQSEPGQGTTISICLPCEPASRATQGLPQNPLEAVSRANMSCILVVDDEPMVLMMSSRLLESIGYTTLRASSGTEALTLFQQHPGDIHAVLLDLTMPGMDGAETFERLRQLQADLPVVISSGYASEEVAERFQGNPPNQIIQKPYLLESLREAISLALNTAA